MFFELSSVSFTRGHALKFKKPQFNTKWGENNFSIRTINDWNKLPEKAVNANNVNGFKSALEEHWKITTISFNRISDSLTRPIWKLHN